MAWMDMLGQWARFYACMFTSLGVYFRDVLPLRHISTCEVTLLKISLAMISLLFCDSRVVTGAVDDYLNDQKFVVPGLGDYGDRYYQTE